VATSRWPEFDASLLVEQTLQIPVQVDGRVRDTITVSPGLRQQEAVAAAEAAGNVSRHLAGRVIAKVIWVPDRLLNLVTRPA
jgi:leucyl-tRNA synthetase